jgi:hypothetical protein
VIALPHVGDTECVRSQCVGLVCGRVTTRLSTGYTILTSMSHHVCRRFAVYSNNPLDSLELAAARHDLSVYMPQLGDPPYRSTTTERRMDPRFSKTTRSTSRGFNRLIALIDETPNNDSMARWQRVNETLLEPQELQVALNHALDLYFQWLTEDLHSLYRLLRGNAVLSQEALHAMQSATNTLHNTFEAGRRRSERTKAVIAELVRSRWARRWEAALAEWHARQ